MQPSLIFCFALHVALLVLVSWFLLHIFGVDDTNNIFRHVYGRFVQDADTTRL